MEGPGISGNYQNIFNCENLNDDFSIPPFSKEAAQVLLEKLDVNETRATAMKVIQCWLESGQCNKNNSDIFFSLLEKSHSFILDLKKRVDEIEKEKENIYSADYILPKLMQGLSLMEEEEEIWKSLTPFQRIDLNVMKSEILYSKYLNSVEEKQNKEASSEHCSLSPIDPYTAQIISLISILLFEKHPSLLNLFEIHSYLTTCIPTVLVSHVEFALRRCPETFKETEDGKWLSLHVDNLIHFQHSAPKRFP